MNIPDLFLIFRGKLSVYHRFFIDPVYQVEEVPIYSCFESFYDDRLDFCLILHVYIEMIILVLYSVSMCIQLIYHVESTFTFMPWRRKWQPTPVFLPGES